MIKAGIIGATGYAGGELVRILLSHKDVKICWYGSRNYIDQKYSNIYQNLFEIVDDVCLDDNMEELAEKVDVIFTATPQGYCSRVMNEDILSKAKVIDLSADFRIKDVDIYEEWYQLKHPCPSYIKEASLRTSRIIQGQDKRSENHRQSGMLSNLLHSVRLSSGPGRND